MRELLSRFDCQRAPESLFNHEVFSQRYKGTTAEEIASEVDSEKELMKLPQIVHTASCMAFNPDMRQVCDEERCVAAHGFEDAAYTEAQEVVWLVAEVEAKLEVEVELADLWWDRLDTLARTAGFRSYQIWLISKEGFSIEANKLLRRRAALTSNRLQLELVRYLGRQHRNVCVVGDDDQSIYGWRGAEIANILEFEAHFANPKIIKLEQNYRSSNAILGLANSIIRHNPRRRPKALWSEKGVGQNVKIVAVPNDREQANYVVSELQKQQLEVAGSWKRFAIIFRMNAQSRLFEEQLRRLQIPYRIIGGRSFFERREVKDLLAYLASLANPNDDLNLLRIINTPTRGIGAATIDLAVAESNQAKTSIFATLQSTGFQELLSAKTRTAVHAFIELIDRYETQIHQPLVELASIATALLEEIRYPEELRRSCKTPEETLNREENVRELVRTLADYQRRSTEGLSGFLAEVALDQEREEESDTDKDGVTLITFHAAKGLEFPHVFLIGIEEGILPHDRSKLEGNLDEERRLFYVGITRAMQTLTITHCANRNKYGGSIPCHPSSFLKDLDQQYVEIVNYHQLANQPASEGTARSHFAKMRELLG